MPGVRRTLREALAIIAAAAAIGLLHSLTSTPGIVLLKRVLGIHG
jgi:hypothetical protein